MIDATAHGQSRRNVVEVGNLARLIAIAAIYFLLSAFEHRYLSGFAHAPVIALSAGLAIAAIWRWGESASGAVFLAACAVELGGGVANGVSACIAAGEALGPWLTVLVLRRFNFDAALFRRRDVALLLSATVAGMGATAANSLIWTIAFGGAEANWHLAWGASWIGHAEGALLSAVPLLAATRQAFREVFSVTRGALNAVLFAIVIGCGSIGTVLAPGNPFALPLLLVSFVLNVVIAMRAGVLPTSCTVLLLAMAVVWNTLLGSGPLVPETADRLPVSLWSYLAALICANALICGQSSELRTARRRQKALFQRAAESILLVGQDGRLQDANPAARKMLGLGSAVARGMFLADLPHGNGEVLMPWLASRGTGAVVSSQPLRLRQEDGTEIDVEVHDAFHLCDPGALITQVILRDVTASRSAEERLASTEGRFRAFTDSVPALMSDHDDRMRYRFANQAYEEWLGIDPSDMIGRTVAEVHGEKVFEEIRPYMEAALRGEAVSYERRTLTSKGERWIQVYLVPRRERDGVVRGFYALASDITASRAAAEALRQSEQRLRSVTERLPMRVSYIDADERIRFANPAYARAYGRTPEELYGLTVREVLGEGAYEHAWPYIRKVMRGEAVSFNSELSTRECYRCYEESYVPQFAEDKKSILGFAAIMADTTHQRREERRLVEQSQVDNVTGLLNRNGLERRLQEAMARSRGSKSLMALICIDIDRFESIGRALGHAAGEALLCGFAGRLSRSLRIVDAAARIGDGRFAVVVEALNKEGDAEVIAETIHGAMRTAFIIDNNSVSIATTVGVTLFRGRRDISIGDLIRQADAQFLTSTPRGLETLAINFAQPSVQA